MRVIAVTNRKGGVGKSTLTVHLGAGLAERGRRVLIADCDPQGQAAVLLGQRKTDALFALLTGQIAPEDALVAVAAHHWTLVLDADGWPREDAIWTPAGDCVFLDPALARPTVVGLQSAPVMQQSLFV